MEAKPTVGEAINILKAESIRASVSNFHGTGALNWHGLVAAKQSPDTTHFAAVDKNKEACSLQRDYTEFRFLEMPT